jgi:triacylglycerol lipase
VSIEDFLLDGEAWRRSIGDGMSAHAGFYDAIISVSHELIDWARLAPRDAQGQKRFVVTGHSLGGALAMLGAKILAGAGFEVQAVYTFGQPRVGDREFARVYDERLGERTFRFVNEEDIVPRVPGWLSGYRHAGVECFLPAMGGLKVKPSLWFKIASDGLGGFWAWRAHRLALLADHGCAKYGEKILKLQDSNGTIPPHPDPLRRTSASHGEGIGIAAGILK